MARRQVLLITGQTYHVYNRTSGGSEIFIQKRQIDHTLELFDYYRYPQKLRYSKFKDLAGEAQEAYLRQARQGPKLVSILAYAVMPDHFHFLVKQLQNDGIKSFVGNFQNAYAKHFNLKTKRFGSLFMHPFKAKLIETDEVLVHVSRYIHLNPVTAYMFEIEALLTSNLTSLPYYRQGKNGSDNQMVDNRFLLERFRGSKPYLDFITDQVDYQRKLAFIKKHLID